ncbi:PREDICTED: kelch-like protein 13 [Branchiostoma belcheri]|uniref:Kelch-like protein 13 n=1 Tax=Branchiostoma belcheri TaxID=7741 RepID=A0A6P4Z8F8_BRABE|nr:PREDICTED: kelch-like protein 13 [Branchiostoma belcheri]
MEHAEATDGHAEQPTNQVTGNVEASALAQEDCQMDQSHDSIACNQPIAGVTNHNKVMPADGGKADQSEGSDAGALAAMLQAHADLLLANAYELREDGVMCDVVLSADGQTLHAHKPILISSSLYFKEKLDSTEIKTLEVDILPFEKLQVMVDLLYGRVLPNTNLSNSEVYKMIKNLGILCGNGITTRRDFGRCLQLHHAEPLLQGLSELRDKEKYTDFTINTDCGSIKVHKLVVASCSDYFKAMFTSGMKEATMDHIDLSGVNGEGLRSLIDFMYTGKMDLSGEKALRQLELATYLQAVSAIDLCCNSFIQSLNLKNCMEMQQIAMEYCSPRLEAAFCDLIARNFKAFTSSADFHKLTVGQMETILSSSSLRVDHEGQVLFAACKWLRYEYEGSRMQHALRLMKRVRFPIMSNRQLMIAGEGPARAIFDKVPDCFSLAEAGVKYNEEISRQPLVRSQETSIRSDFKTVVVFGGSQESNQTANVYYLYPPTKEWKRLGKVQLPQAVSYHSCAVINNFVYIAGGESNAVFGYHSAMSSVWRFMPNWQDGRHGRWYRAADMRENRTDFYLAATNDRLYAVAGRNGNHELSSVEVYDPETNTWDFEVSQLESPVYGHAGVVHDGVIYVCGGGFMNEYRADLWCMNPHSTQGWSQKASMRRPRAFHHMSAVGDCLYAMGGYQNSTGEDIAFYMHFAVADVFDVECYNIRTGQWTSVQSLVAPQTGGASITYNGEIYLLGGWSFSVEPYCTLSDVHTYNPTRNSWQRFTQLPEKLGGSGCCVITLPQSFGRCMCEEEEEECYIHPPTNHRQAGDDDDDDSNDDDDEEEDNVEETDQEVLV